MVWSVVHGPAASPDFRASSIDFGGPMSRPSALNFSIRRRTGDVERATDGEPATTRLGRKAGRERWANRILAALAHSRRIDQLQAEALYRNRHNLYRTTNRPTRRSATG